MGILLDKTRRLTFNEALDLLIQEYRERHVGYDIIAEDLYNMAEEVELKSQGTAVWRAR